MKLLITGVSHKTAPVELREKLAFAEGILPHVLADLTAREGISEAMILSTCNRVEIIVSAADQTDDNHGPPGCSWLGGRRRTLLEGSCTENEANPPDIANHGGLV